MSEVYLEATEPEMNPFVAVMGLLILFARHKRIIALVTVTASVLGVAYSLMLAPRYTATARILTPQQAPSLAGLMMSQMAASGAGPLITASGGGFGLKSPNEIYVGMLKARPVVDATILKCGLATENDAKDMERSRRVLDASTTITSEKSGMIAITVGNRDKELAAKLANAYPESLRDLLKSLAVREASQRRSFYEEQMKSAKDALISAELAFREMQQKGGVVQPDAQGKALIESITSLRAKIASKEVELRGLRSFSTESNPDVEMAENQLAGLKQEAAKMGSAGSAKNSADLGLQDIAGAGSEYLSAEHELQYRQIMFDLMLKQYDAARLDEAKFASVVQVVESAIPPQQRTSPHRSMIVLEFSGMGFAGACFTIFIMDFLKRNPQLNQPLKGLRAALAGK
jgi:uncharacterized protein involved in exopolysaccharide biosynthesis